MYRVRREEGRGLFRVVVRWKLDVGEEGREAGGCGCGEHVCNTFSRLSCAGSRID